MKTGIIYLIRNLVNGKVYVGQTDRTLRKRWTNHCSDAKNVPSTFLHRAINKYKRESFSIELLETVDIGLLDEAEIKWIAHYESFTDRTKGYNLTAGGGGIRGMKHTDEAKAKISAAHSGDKHYFFGKTHLEETKKLISEASKGIPKSDEAKANMSAAQKGKPKPPGDPIHGNQYALDNTYRLGIPHTDETKAKISESKMGEIWTPEARAAHLVGVLRGEDHPNFGKKLPEETRSKMSLAKTGTKRSPEECEAISKFHTGRKRKPETIARMIEAAKNKAPRGPASEDTKERMKKSQSDRRAAEKQAGVTIKAASGAAHGMFGKQHSDETKAKMKAYWADRRALKAA